jgi:plastocyanin
MAFYLDGAGAPNPTIQMVPGERVKITLVNDDAGIVHDVAFPSLSAKSGTVRGGGSVSMIVQMPLSPGATEYICSLHGRMMKGTFEVIAPQSARAR